MSIALITGGSGHVGANLVRELTAQDYKVRCIDFDGDHRAFEGYDVELITGSVTDIDTLDKAFEGVDVVFHTAAIISLERKNKSLIRSVNVEGTKNVCKMSLKHSIRKLIHFSSVDAFIREPLEDPLLEDRSLVVDQNAVPYDLSKADAQRIVLEYCDKGLDASIIHPSGIFGPNDFKPSLFGQEFIKIANSKRPFSINVGYDYVDVRDLSKTAVNCISKGVSGQNYIVGGNYMDFVYMADVMSQELGRKLIRGTLPFVSIYLSLPMYYLLSFITKTPRAITLDSIHTIKVQNKNIPSQLSKDQLDHTPRPIEETITDTLKFFNDVGAIA
ncbi:NAD-dependent epimerase/dehydratase family protein [Acidimicrobiia bacterium]|jgi:dihydroflavonol-4-reductase|nr:NAD-dependent epimerase/dehydratase family protein [bacterium]MDA7594626.1 NAD-dependent epimerase/dehydratase family protein [Acidimicrobiia bacterium]MDA7721268.1 NAD-dependent epimerase/dehydratase family protein [Acidimicrobiaceae bacterium]MDA8667579.1 NAD-dependent epimerase/dehydratase family protein [Candidatus Actinomarina sp.]MDA8719522.1 NAD-dependent epimerase/dehydratase family protein [Candidatus Actinomarina sp.]|tara:strand:+ start:96 stop:1085 length:990 start_codon:yes stop_codon:yes gene_type:complete